MLEVPSPHHSDKDKSGDKGKDHRHAKESDGSFIRKKVKDAFSLSRKRKETRVRKCAEGGSKQHSGTVSSSSPSSGPSSAEQPSPGKEGYTA